MEEALNLSSDRLLGDDDDDDDDMLLIIRGICDLILVGCYKSTCSARQHFAVRSMPFY